MIVGRRHFLAGSGAVLTAGALAAPAGAFPTELPPHEHGINGTKLNLHTHYNLKLRILDGPDWQLESARGSVVFLNFFATWCPPCRAETPDLVAFAAAHPEVVTIIVDVQEKDDTVRAYRKKFDIPCPIGMDESGGFMDNIGTHAFPTTLIFRPDGRLSCAFVGSGSAEAFEDELAYARQPDPAGTPSP